VWLRISLTLTPSVVSNLRLSGAPSCFTQVGDLLPAHRKKELQAARMKFYNRHGKKHCMDGFQKELFAYLGLEFNPEMTEEAADALLNHHLTPEASSSSFQRLQARHFWYLTNDHGLAAEEVVKLSASAASALLRQLENPEEPKEAPQEDAFMNDLLAPSTPAKRSAPASATAAKAKAPRTARAVPTPANN
jgi:hypothetical protein